METVRRESKRRGLKINVKKTECRVIKKEKEKTQCKVKIGDEEIKQVEKFNYLGSLITSDGKCDADIKKRIAMAKDTFEKLSNIFKNRKLNIKIKNKLLKCYVHSALLYGSECWTISPTTENKLKATEMCFYRRMMRISWKDHVSNEKVLRRANTKRSLIKTSVRES